MNHLTSESYKSAIASGEKCVVDFFATWCGPCKVMNPILESVNTKIGEGKIFKVDVEQNRDLVEKLGIRSVPTFIFYDNGIEIERKSGVIQEKYILETLN